jgi:Phosphotransferase enzyme family
VGEIHARFGDALTLLGDVDAVVAKLDGADDQPEWWPAGASWKRTFGRFEPDRPAMATLSLERIDGPQTIVLVKVYAEQAPETSGVWAVPLAGVGTAHVRRFPDDPSLPTLARVVDAPGVQIVRYRPEKRCTLRVDGADGPEWVKVFTDDRGAGIHRATVALWDAAQRGQLEVAVAPPVRFDAATRSVWQGHVAGTMITKRLFSEEGPALARRLGAALGSIASITATPELRFDGAVQLDRSRRYAETIRRVIPELSAQLDAVVQGLERLHASAQGRARPIHGAPHPEQWLDDDGALGLIDFDRFSLGDPELDITTFQAEVDFERLPGALRDEINAAFRDGYEHRAGALDARLLIAYRTHKRLAKVLRSARALRPDGDVRAARHLERVRAVLTGEFDV